jgi:hypothetical protein
MLMEPPQRLPTVLNLRGMLVFGRKPIVDSHDHIALLRDLARVAGIESFIAGDPSSTVNN